MAPSFPTEIWIKIFENLCVHCQQPKDSEDIPDFRLPDARDGQAALKALSLVSQECRSISQGILFHYFYNVSNGGGYRPPSENLIAGLLRTLVAKPSMGRQVRMITFFQCKSDKYHGITRQDLQDWTRASSEYHIHVPGEVTQLLATQESDKNSILYFKGTGPGAQLQSTELVAGTEVPVLKWLYVMALHLVPHATHIQFDRPLGSLEQLKTPAPTFPQVRVLTYELFNTMEDIVECQARFPNVSRLWAQDIWHREPAPTINSLTPTMMHIRKLTVSCTPRSLTVLLQFCPNLEDLEAHMLTLEWYPEPVSALEWPEHVKTTLRRLAWSNADAITQLQDNRVDVAFFPPLRDFSRLEILEIDQVSILLYSMSLKAKTLSYVLPETLRVLHIGYARDVLSPLQISRQLRDLVRAKATTLAKLYIVKIDDSPRRNSKKASLAEFMGMTGVVSLMRLAGIDARFGLEGHPKVYFTRLMQPPPPGAAVGDDSASYQDEAFALDDLETS